MSGPYVLSPREAEIAELVAQGYTNQQIADLLCLARQTVKNYVAEIMHKMDAPSRVRIAVSVVQYGVVGRNRYGH